MSIKQNLYDVVIHSNIYISLGATSIGLASFLLFNMNINIFALLIIFLVAFSMYSLNRKTDIEEDIINNPNRAKFIKKYSKHLTKIVFVSYIIAIIMAFFRNIETVFIVLLPLFLGILYSIKLIPIASKRVRLKDIASTKNATVAFTWGIVTVLIPAFYTNFNISVMILSFFIFVFLRIFIGAIFFDMRDIKGDMERGVRTIPVILGDKKTWLFLFILNTISLLVVLLFVLLGWLPSLAYFLSLSIIWGYVYLFLYNKINMKFLCDVIVDGEYIAIGIFVFLGTLIL